MEDNNDEHCTHLRVYDESLLIQDIPVFKWTCSRCGTSGVSNAAQEIIYNYNQFITSDKKVDDDG